MSSQQQQQQGAASLSLVSGPGATAPPGSPDARAHGMPPAASAHAGVHGNVNVLLGGAMLSGVIMVVFLVCYCCHRNMRKGAPERASQQYQWAGDQELPELPLEVFTVDGLCYEVSGAVLVDGCQLSSAQLQARQQQLLQLQLQHQQQQPRTAGQPAAPPPPPPPRSPPPDYDAVVLRDSKQDDQLPSYEAALRLEAHGYV
ncbi:uncharacterized protein LOC126272293 [Schistocerca gregaria]|uniref:uncharacterized protein LOC126272293 n=1 Tax=Schistocerca gregaria TaxID=7010 RepID=UPI00211DC8A1|nr:uncharacterized protein LOC126272293 [Schistocerca gregaria]